VTIDVMIAGRRIRLWSEEGVTIRPDERFSSFIVEGYPPAGGEQTAGVIQDVKIIPEDAEPELTVEVIPGSTVIPGDAARVFDAQLMEEGPEGPQKTGEPFWEILSGGGRTYASVSVKDSPCNPVLVMPDGIMNWQIYADSEDNDIVNPLPYPVDGLLLYFLTSAGGDIMIHGSGVVCGGRGWVFTGRSGSGKTTLASIFDRAGDRVIHDDRLILRKEGGGWVMHSTPVYRDDEPRSAFVDHVWAISHGSANVSTPVSGAEAAAMLLSNCIQQNWDRMAAARLAASVEELVKEVRVSKLTFIPDTRLRDYLSARASDNAVTAAGAASAILGEDMTVTITAGGYSMWPAIRPGDKLVIEPLQGRVPALGDGVAIEPLQNSIPAPGDIVALRRDGGYVVHRVTEVIDREGRSYFRTQGDAVTRHDEPADISIIAGTVHKLIRKGKERTRLRKRLPSWFNRIVSVILSSITR